MSNGQVIRGTSRDEHEQQEKVFAGGWQPRGELLLSSTQLKQPLERKERITTAEAAPALITKPAAAAAAAATCESCFGCSREKCYNNNNSSSSDNNNNDKHMSTFKVKPTIQKTNQFIAKQQQQAEASTTTLALALDKNSLESINSKFSISSANEDQQQQQQPQNLELKQQQQLTNQYWSHKSVSSFCGSPTATTNNHSTNCLLINKSQSNATLSTGGGGGGGGGGCGQAANRHSLGHYGVGLSRYCSPPKVPARSGELPVSNVDATAATRRSTGSAEWLEQQRRQLKVDDYKQATCNDIHQGNATAGHPLMVAKMDLNNSNNKQQQPNERASQDNNNNNNNISDNKKYDVERLAVKSAKSACEGTPNGHNSNNSNTRSSSGEAKPQPPFMFAGIAASIVGSVFFSLSILCIKLLPDNEGIQDRAKLLFFRGVFMMSLCAVTIISTRSTFIVRRDELWVNILRACFGTMGIFGTYCALKYISMGDTTALIFSSPIWTSILSHFILKEPLQWIQLFALPICLLGIILIAHPTLIVSIDLLIPSAAESTLRPLHLLNLSAPPHHQMAYPIGDDIGLANGTTDNWIETATTTTRDSLAHAVAEASFDFEHRWPGIMIALMTSLCVSCTYIVLKFRKKTPIQTTTFWLSCAMIVVSIIIMSTIGLPKLPETLWEWSLLLGNGFSSWVGQTVLQWAFLHEEASVLSIVRTLDVAATFILSALFLDDEIYWTSIVGATIIGLIVVAIMFNNWIRKSTSGGNSIKEVVVVVAAAAAAEPTIKVTNSKTSSPLARAATYTSSNNDTSQQQQQSTYEIA